MIRVLIAGLALFVAACAAPANETGPSVDTATASAGSGAPDTAGAGTTSANDATVTTNEGTKPMSEYENKVAEVKTTLGTFSLRFFPQVAPNHVRNFIDLSQQGFYNGTRFHRTVPGFVIQGGDPNTKSGNPASWGTGGSGRNIKGEFSSIHHRPGILSMARSNDRDSASSQFFVVVGDAGFLDNDYTVFGEVTSGMDVVNSIVSAPARGESPVNPVTIESVTIREANENEKGPLPK